MENKSANPVKIAIQMEIDGMEFYKKAAEATKSPLGKKMFLSFVEDEKNHLRALQMIFNGDSADLMNDVFKESSPSTRIKTVFTNAKEEAKAISAQEADPDEINALETAMDMEKEGYDYYMDIAKNSDNETMRELFKALAKEENEHYTILQNTHTYLTDTGNWFLWEEMGVIDGG